MNKPDVPVFRFDPGSPSFTAPDYESLYDSLRRVPSTPYCGRCGDVMMYVEYLNALCCPSCENDVIFVKDEI